MASQYISEPPVVSFCDNCVARILCPLALCLPLSGSWAVLDLTSSTGRYLIYLLLEVILPLPRCTCITTLSLKKFVVKTFNFFSQYPVHSSVLPECRVVAVLASRPRSGAQHASVPTSQ